MWKLHRTQDCFTFRIIVLFAFLCVLGVLRGEIWFQILGRLKGTPMAIQKWSDNITVVELSEEPQFTDELNSVMDALVDEPSHVVLNFAAIGFINSSNVARLLRLRKLVTSHQRKLMLCNVSTQVWGVFLVTGLDKIFEFNNDISTALTMLQLGAAPPAKNHTAKDHHGGKKS
jgi:anti-anti-sigma factor